MRTDTDGKRVRVLKVEFFKSGKNRNPGTLRILEFFKLVKNYFLKVPLQIARSAAFFCRLGALTLICTATDRKSQDTVLAL
jgi:hypothetical protein